MNGTSSVPNSFPHLVLNKVRLLSVSENIACLWSKMSGIQMVRQVTWLNHLNTGQPYCPVFRWIRYSDESSIQVFGIQMVTNSFLSLLWQLLYFDINKIKLTGSKSLDRNSKILSHWSRFMSHWSHFVHRTVVAWGLKIKKKIIFTKFCLSCCF